METREIKFRGLRVDGKEWVYGFYMESSVLHHMGNRSLIVCNDSNVSYAGRDFIEVKPESVGQYTGLKDKNGNEIYEGDIVQTIYFDIFKVEYGMQCVDAFIGYGFNLWTFYDDENDGKGYNPNDKRLRREIQVIGNIHQNPELLK